MTLTLLSSASISAVSGSGCSDRSKFSTNVALGAAGCASGGISTSGGVCSPELCILREIVDMLVCFDLLPGIAVVAIDYSLRGQWVR